MAKSKPKQRRKATSPAAVSAAQERKWRAESDLRTLTEAAAIRADKQRVAAAKREAEAQVKALSKAVTTRSK